MPYLTLLLPQNPAAVVSINELGKTEKRSPFQCFCLLSCWTGQQSFLCCEEIPATLENRRPRPCKSQCFGPMAKTETWQIASYENGTNLCSDFWWIKKKKTITDFSGCIFSPKLETLSSSRSMDIIDEKEEYTDRGLGNLREAEHLLKTCVCLIYSDASHRGLLSFSHIINPSCGNSGFSTSCDIWLLSLPFIAMLNPATYLSRIFKIHLLSATSWANSCWHYYTACSLASLMLQNCSAPFSHALQMNTRFFLLLATPAHSQ